MNTTCGLMLVNLGTPDSTRTSDVRRYLREFLSDPRVIDLPPWRRWLLLNLFILPFRPRASAEAYRKIWTAGGSPLLVHSVDLAEKLSAVLGDGVRVELAMRYQNPSIVTVLARFREAGIDRIVVVPLFPQYSSAAWGSCRSLRSTHGRCCPAAAPTSWWAWAATAQDRSCCWRPCAACRRCSWSRTRL